MTEKKKKSEYDKTSKQRQTAHLKKLAAENGKRLPVDLDAERIKKIDDLISAGVGSSAAAVIRTAIDELHEKTATKLEGGI